MLRLLERAARAPGAMSVAIALVIVAVVTGSYWTVGSPDRHGRSYCAMLPDAVGLYTDNAVTLRGVTVGSVTSIRTVGTGVRVDFTVAGDHPLRGPVSATTLSTTLVADRQLAVINGAAGDLPIASGDCITSTLTPKSLTETLSAVRKLTSELGNAPGGSASPLGDGIAALDGATTGSGPEINAIIHRLATALRSPDAAIGRLDTVLRSLSSLSHSLANGWGDLKSMLTRFATALDQADNELLNQAVDVIDSLRVIVPWVNSITRTFGGTILKTVDATVPLLHAIAGEAGTIRNILDRAPILAAAFTGAVDPRTREMSMVLRAPRIAAATADPTRTCAAVNAVSAAACRVTGDRTVGVDVASVLAGVTGGSRR